MWGGAFVEEDKFGEFITAAIAVHKISQRSHHRSGSGARGGKVWQAAGAMIWMTLSELIPEAPENATIPMIASAVTVYIVGLLVFELLLRSV